MTIQNLRERLGALKKEARNLVENKGSATWTKEEQDKFDNLADEAERTERQIEAHQRLLDNEAEDSFSKLPTKEHGQPNDVRELPADVAKTLVKSGDADDDKTAVAYAAGLPQNQKKA